MSDSSPYKIPRAPGRWRAITLAVVVHLALLAFFWIGINWQNETPLTVEAEIWDPQYKEAAPLPTPPEPQPQPEPPKPEPVPQPQPEPKAPPKVIDEPKVEKPDINLEKEKEKKRKEELEKKEKAEKLKAEKEREKKEQEEKDKAEREKQQKLDADKQKKLKEEKQKEEEAKKKADAEKQVAEKKKQQQAAADAKAAEQRRQDDLKRMMGQATSATGGTGTAEKSQGPRGNPDYANKLRAKIRSNTIFDVPADLSGNPAVEYTVELFPDGTVRSIRNGKSSGVPGFDEAVKQAITKSQPFPPDKDGKVPGSFTFTHKPKDQ